MACCQPMIIPDPLDPNYGPSADNIPIPSSQPGTPPEVALITSGFGEVFYTVASDLLPQPSATTNWTYRFTFNGYIDQATIDHSGNITFFAELLQTDNQARTIAAQTIWVVPGAVGEGNIRYWVSMSGIFIPNPGDQIKISLFNQTGGDMSNVIIQVSPKGCGIELVSKASAPELIFS